MSSLVEKFLGREDPVQAAAQDLADHVAEQATKQHTTAAARLPKGTNSSKLKLPKHTHIIAGEDGEEWVAAKPDPEVLALRALENAQAK